MKKCILVLLAVLCLTGTAFADAKIGYVDLQKALNQSKAGVSAKSDISKLVKKYEDQFKQMQEDLKTQKTNLEKQAGILSESARADKEREYQQSVKELQRFQKDVKDELQAKDADHTKRIINELFDILKKIGKDDGYTVILEKNEGAVIYADESIDLTDQLIKRYDAAQK